MSELKPLPETALTTLEGVEEVPFDASEIKKEMSFYLKHEHNLPKASVDYLLAQFTKLAKQDREDTSLRAVLLELVLIALTNSSGALSPRYIAIAAYAKTKGVEILEVAPETQASAQVAEQTAAVLNGEKTDHPTSDFPSEEVSSDVRSKFAELMNMDPPQAVRHLFPSIPDMVLNAVVLKILQGPTAEETNDINWHVNYFTNLVEQFPFLLEDLRKQGIALPSAARALVARGQKETNRAAVERAERMKSRGQLATIQGIHVSELQEKIKLEVALAGARQSLEEKLAAPAEAVQTENGAPADEDDEDSRPTSVPDSYDAKKIDTQKEIQTVEIDTRAVRGQLPTLQAIDAYIPPEAIGSEAEMMERSERVTMAPEELTAPQKPKKGRVRKALGKLFGSGDEED